MKRRVVVTGMGTVNPLGNNVNDFWKAIKAGENGIGKLTRFESNGFTLQGRRGGEGLRAREAPGGQGSAPHGPFHAVRHGCLPGSHG